MSGLGGVRFVVVLGLVWLAGCDDGDDPADPCLAVDCPPGQTCHQGTCIGTRADAAPPRVDATRSDGAPLDAAPPDGGRLDAGPVVVDAQPTDAALDDAALADAALDDAALDDAALGDATPGDAALGDAALGDAALDDAALADAALDAATTPEAGPRLDVGAEDVEPPEDAAAEDSGPSADSGARDAEPRVDQGCVAADERCNGADDDCDGAIDEGLGLGEVCALGMGACRAEGRRVCGPGELIACDALIGEPADEQCNGVDDDCDGLTDEGLGVGAPCVEGVGACRMEGVTVCDAAGAVGCDAVADAPTDERCNGVDDDCDGGTDEDYAELGEACAVGVGACAAEGTQVCTAEGDATTCDAIPAPPSDESCNGEDDDCNGAVDDLVPSLPDHCGACGRACAVPNAQPGCVEGDCAVDRCLEGWIDADGQVDNGCEQRCVPTDPPEEACDGFDNDCDGVVDGDDACLGALGFCTRRAALLDPLGARDWFCQDFPAGALDGTHWTFSAALPGEALPQLSRRAYTGAEGDPTAGGGHTTRVPYAGAALRLSYGVTWGGTLIGVGLFDGNARADDLPENPGFGYGLTVEGAEAPVVVLRAWPTGAELIRVEAPALADEAIHRVQAEREAAGAWRLAIDGRRVGPAEGVVDLDVPGIDRITYFAAAHDGGGSVIDDVVLEVDALDTDGVYPPADNCPFVANADQADGDDDGRGAACQDLDLDGVEAADGCPAVADPDQADTDEDGIGDACDTEGRSLVLAFDAPTAAWAVDLPSGVRRRFGAGIAGVGELAVHPQDGRRAWVRDQVVETAGPAGEDPLPLALNGTHPGWLADDRVLYVAAGGAEVWSIEADGTDPSIVAEAEAGETLDAWPVREGAEIAVLRAGPGGISVTALDLVGRVLAGPVDLPAPPGDHAPWIDRHPTEDRWLIAGTAGDLGGVGELDPVRERYLALGDLPASAAIYAAGGTTVVALEQVGGGHRVATYGVADAAESVIVTPSAGLRPDTLGLVALPEAVPLADADGDRLHDDSDLCPRRPPWESLGDPVVLHSVRRGAPQDGGTIQEVELAWTGTEYAATWAGEYQSCCCWSSEASFLGRVDIDGERRAPVEIINRCDNGCGCDRTAAWPVWTGTQYHLLFGREGGALSRTYDVHTRAFGASRTLAASTVIRVDARPTEDGLVAFAGSTYAALDDVGGAPMLLDGLVGGSRQSEAVMESTVGGYVVVTTGIEGVLAAVITADGQRLGGLATLDGSTAATAPSIVATDDGFLVGWLRGGRVRLRRLNANAIPLDGTATLPGVATGGPGLIAVEGGPFVAWPVEEDGARHRVLVARLEDDGALRTTPRAVGPPLGEQSFPAVGLASDGRDLALAFGWQRNADASQTARYEVRFARGAWHCEQAGD